VGKEDPIELDSIYSDSMKIHKRHSYIGHSFLVSVLTENEWRSLNQFSTNGNHKLHTIYTGSQLN